MPDVPGTAVDSPAVDGTAVVGPWSEPPRPRRRALGVTLIAIAVGLFVIGILLTAYSQPECIGTPPNCVYLPFDPYSGDAAIVLVLAVVALVFGLAFLLWLSPVPKSGVPQPAWLMFRCRNCGKLVDPSLARCDRCGAAAN